jgi:predicted RNase H-like nuclease (RuvC/YqgF family)
MEAAMADLKWPKLRAEIAKLRAEVERLTRERDERNHDGCAALAKERDDLRAQLAAANAEAEANKLLLRRLKTKAAMSLSWSTEDIAAVDAILGPDRDYV